MPMGEKTAQPPSRVNPPVTRFMPPAGGGGGAGGGNGGNGGNGGLNSDGGCAVDWSWLNGERIASIWNSLDTLTITFESGRVFTTRAMMWQGQPFLGFKPHAPPAHHPEVTPISRP